MPKRKRNVYEDGAGNHAASIQKKDIEEKLSQSRKLLHRALKTAKGFERQKLGKRLKVAKEANSQDEMGRINREIEALKGLDLGKETEAQLCRVLLKVKAFAESDALPAEVKNRAIRSEGSEEERQAVHNVVSGMCNMKNVKEVIAQVVGGMYLAMGIPAPVAGKGKGKGKGEVKKEAGKSILKSGDLGVPRRIETGDHKGLDEEEGKEVEVAAGSDELSWEGFDSGDKNNEIEEERGAALTDEAENEELDEEALSRYDALLGGSSDEESFDESEYLKPGTSRPSTRLSLSLSPSPSESQSQSPPPNKAPKAAKAKKEPPPRPGGSTFLPTLMGGYWSGSESSASDLEDDALTAAPVRKNRPGQMARRAIWEKKFGAGANHIKSGQGSVRRTDDGWDAARGATDGKRGRGREGGGVRQRDFRQATGDNAILVEPKKKTRDDVGILHPSWEAAKKAKEMKTTATFEGKKVTFD